MHILQTDPPTNDTISIICNQKNKELYTLARWAALLESVNMIADKAEEKQISFDRLDLKPLKILEYVDASSDIIMRKLLEEKEKTEQTIAKACR